MTVFVYVNTSRQVGDAEHIKVFANQDAAEKWFEEDDERRGTPASRAHVSQLIAAGLDVRTISRRIGHASPAITPNVYGHLFSHTDTRAADIMEATFVKVRGTE
jgi:integrase